jgi:putative FmdB family regulatory protein
MPIYTYRCTECGVQFDKQQKFTDQPLKRCPECAKNSLQKVFQPVGIVFKGSGFYSTDHRSPSGSASRNTKSGESEKSSETGSKSTENSTSTDSSKSSSTKSET